MELTEQTPWILAEEKTITSLWWKGRNVLFNYGSHINYGGHGSSQNVTLMNKEDSL